MWAKEYRDYPTDTPLNKMHVESNRGIVGCEMHERMGWGTTLHIPTTQGQASRWQRLLRWLLRIPKAHFPEIKPAPGHHHDTSIQ